MWIFGYGSLMWRPGFAFEEKAVARLAGFRRVFWQGSPDHRGTPERPGRVVTLVSDANSVCEGLAFRTSFDGRCDMLAQLDRREQGGYARTCVTLRLTDGRQIQALTYVGDAANPHFLGPQPLPQMARHIGASHGPSGANVDYLLCLVRTLRGLGIDDPHCEALASHVRGL